MDACKANLERIGVKGMYPNKERFASFINWKL